MKNKVNMERKIGEIFEYNGEWHQCVRSILTCSACEIPKPCTKIRGLGYCSLHMRNDKEQVVFKKLEKVGEPYEFSKVLMQKYIIYAYPIIPYNFRHSYIRSGDNKTISIEIKQKEDMEEKKLNLKPFDLEAAKAGKPVCTRDGRNVRIICFDRKDVKSIVALVESSNDEREDVCCYNADGLNLNNPSVFDLMMLPEKKEGWVNVYKERVYDTKEEAVKAKYDGATYVDTVNINWEE